MRRRPSIDRLLSRCVERGGCWVYTGKLASKGYVRLRDDNGNLVQGHRLAWNFFIGEFPPGLTYDHLCRNKACVNPWHGEPVPSGVNSRRAPGHLSVVNAAKTHCPQGHPLSGDNLLMVRPGPGKALARTCRICRNEAYRRYHRKRRALNKKEVAS